MPDGGALDRQGFLRFLLHDYQPHEREQIKANDTTYLPGTSYPQICQTRTWLLYQALTTHLDLTPGSAAKSVLDIGLYPGTQARVLAQLLGPRIRLAGVGLGFDAGFARDLATAVPTLREIDLDPFYAGLDTPIRIDLPDASFDAIHALEVFEHLISPLVFLGECRRLLKPGGILCLSTPNVSHLGALWQLLRGRSNYEAIDASPMYQARNPWRGHSRLYAKDELVTLGARFGLTLVSHEYYREAGAGYLAHGGTGSIKRALGRLVAGVVPHLRDDQFAVFRRPTGPDPA